MLFMQQLENMNFSIRYCGLFLICWSYILSLWNTKKEREETLPDESMRIEERLADGNKLKSEGMQLKNKWNELTVEPNGKIKLLPMSVI